MKNLKRIVNIISFIIILSILSSSVFASTEPAGYFSFNWDNESVISLGKVVSLSADINDADLGFIKALENRSYKIGFGATKYTGSSNVYVMLWSCDDPLDESAFINFNTGNPLNWASLAALPQGSILHKTLKFSSKGNDNVSAMFDVPQNYMHRYFYLVIGGSVSSTSGRAFCRLYQ